MSSGQLLLVLMFVAQNSPAFTTYEDFEKYTCRISMSPDLSKLKCSSNSNKQVYTILQHTLNETEVPHQLSDFLDEFYISKDTFKSSLFRCEYELVLVPSDADNSEYEENCVKEVHYSINDFKDILNTSIVVALEISNFSTTAILAELNFPDLISLTVQDIDLRSNVSEIDIEITEILTHFTLTKTRIHSLPFDFFPKSSNLQFLNLSHNMITDFLYFPFSRLQNLTRLDLSHNKLTVIRYDFFLGLNKLKMLNISFNLLFNIHTGAFQKLSSLILLRLSNNNLKYLAERLFDKLSNLSILVLSDNQINYVPRANFKYLPKLVYLDLRNNKLTRINQLHDQKDLVILNVSGNRIQALTKNFFRDIKHLKAFDLSDNRIKEFDFSTLTYLSDLVILNISNNYIMNISNNKGVIIKVREVDLSGNNISSFSFFERFLPHLKYMNLDHNRFENVDYLMEIPYANWHLNHNITVSFAYNNIETINMTKLMVESIGFSKEKYTINESMMRRYIHFDLSKNPFECDCKLYSFYRHVNKNNDNKEVRFINLNNVTCSSPKSLKNNIIHMLSGDELVCPIKEACPYPCGCGIRGKDRRIFVNCTGAHLDTVIKFPPKDVTVLYLNRNNLTSLASLNNGIWRNLIYLHADKNNICTLEDWDIPPSLQYLSVRDNKLRMLPSSLLHFISSQEHFELWIGENGRNCECQTNILKNFLEGNESSVMDSSEFLCDYEIDGTIVSSPLRLVPHDVLCAQPSNVLLINLLSCLLLLLIITLILFTQRYLILSLFYTHGNNCICFNCFWKFEAEDKIFDAFVSCSIDDNQIVTAIVQELEGHEPHFKVCIHECDELYEGFISNDIIRAFHKSSRTILVLSEKFISHPWFKTELTAAIIQIPKDEIRRIIVILVNKKTSLKTVDRQLRRILNQGTLLVFGEQWFWDKLRYAMPHKISENISLN